MSDVPPLSLSEAVPSVMQRAEQFDLLVERAADFAIFLLDAQGNVATWNEGARHILGYDEVEALGQNVRDFYTPEDQAQGVPERQLQRAREQGRAENERWQMRKDGSRFYACGVDQALRLADGTLRGYSLIFRDQTEQRQRLEALQASEERYRRTVESVMEYAIFTLDVHGDISEWNLGAERVLGYPAEVIIGQPVSLLFTPEDITAGEVQKELQQAAAEGRAQDERWHVRQDGSRFWASGMLMRMHDGAAHRFIKVMRDMTASQRAEEERSQQQAQIAVLRERNRMAQELHDTLSQGFTGIKMQMDAAEYALQGENSPHQAIQDTHAHIVRARQIAQQSLVEVRSSIRGLRAPLLEGSSLDVALQRLAAMATNGVKVNFVLEGTPVVLSASMENDLYRIGQEALTNALRHAQATHVVLELTYTTTQVRLRIHDDGQGFDTQAGRAGFGLIGMQERAQRLAAEWTLHSQPGQGTEVLLRVPLIVQ